MVQNLTHNPTGSRWFRYLLLIAFTVLIVAGMAFFRMQALPAAAAPASQTVQTGYTASVLNNHVVIYSSGQTQPSLVTEIDIRALPLADQNALRKGIPLPDDEALARLLEDYGS